jgi:homogentisate 1,2-dioxygenase
MSELMGLITGAYDAKADGFQPGGVSLHNAMSAHGPDRASWTKASNAALTPDKIENTLAFMFESRWPFRPTAHAMQSPTLQSDYDACWSGFEKARLP